MAALGMSAASRKTVRIGEPPASGLVEDWCLTGVSTMALIAGALGVSAVLWLAIVAVL